VSRQEQLQQTHQKQDSQLKSSKTATSQSQGRRSSQPGQLTDMNKTGA
jgi:hypothetical protein